MVVTAEEVRVVVETAVEAMVAVTVVEARAAVKEVAATVVGRHLHLAGDAGPK